MSIRRRQVIGVVSPGAIVVVRHRSRACGECDVSDPLGMPGRCLTREAPAPDTRCRFWQYRGVSRIPADSGSGGRPFRSRCGSSAVAGAGFRAGLCMSAIRRIVKQVNAAEPERIAKKLNNRMACRTAWWHGAIDGKLLKVRLDRRVRSVHLVSAMTHREVATIGQPPASAGRNELTWARSCWYSPRTRPGMIAAGGRAGRRKIAHQRIGKRWVDSVLAVRTNQPTMPKSLVAKPASPVSNDRRSCAEQTRPGRNGQMVDLAARRHRHRLSTRRADRVYPPECLHHPDGTRIAKNTGVEIGGGGVVAVRLVMVNAFANIGHRRNKTPHRWCDDVKQTRTGGGPKSWRHRVILTLGFFRLNGIINANETTDGSPGPTPNPALTLRSAVKIIFYVGGGAGRLQIKFDPGAGNGERY
jgi:hypothetical protein